MKKKLKQCLAIALAAVTVAGSAAYPATYVSAATQKVCLVTQKTDDDGYTTKYSYNKSGFLTKRITTVARKSSSSDYSYKATTSYKYNKKNRIASSTYSSTSTRVSYETDDDGKIKSGGKTTKSTDTSSNSTKYTYNKNGLLTQKVTTSYSSDIPENSNETETNEYEYWNGTDYVKGTSTETRNTTYQSKGNGAYTRTYTYTYTHPEYDSNTNAVVTYTRTRQTVEDFTNKTVTTTKYTYDKKKRVKSAVTDTVYYSTEKEVNTGSTTTGAQVDQDSKREYNNNSSSTSRTTDKYTYNKKGKASKVVTVSEPDYARTYESENKYTYSDNTTHSSSTKTTYANNKKTTVESSLNSDGSVTTTTKEVAYPGNKNTYTTTYVYDKAGNVKSTKASYVDVNNRKNTYTVDANGERQTVYNKLPDGSNDYDAPVYTSETTKSKSSSSYETELKANTARLTKELIMRTPTVSGREKYDSYSMSRNVYKVTTKKLSTKVAKDVEKQQWIIQNGHLNGEAGL